MRMRCSVRMRGSVRASFCPKLFLNFYAFSHTVPRDMRRFRYILGSYKRELLFFPGFKFLPMIILFVSHGCRRLEG